jgi:hypothetical protein
VLWVLQNPLWQSLFWTQEEQIGVLPGEPVVLELLVEGGCHPLHV